MKNDKPFICPLSPLAVEIIETADPSGKRYAIFESRLNAGGRLTRHALSHAVRGKPHEEPPRVGIADFLGMEHWTPHDLRRTASTLMRRRGVSREHLEAQLAHYRGAKAVAVYDRYDLLAEKRAAVLVLEDELRRIITLPAPVTAAT